MKLISCLAFLFQQMELFWAKNRREEGRKEENQRSQTQPPQCTLRQRIYNIFQLQLPWKIHSIRMSGLAVRQERARLVSHQVRLWLWCEPKHRLPVSTQPQPCRRMGHTSLLPQFLHLKQQHLPTSHQSPEKVNSCVQSAFRMKAHFISLLSATAVNLAEIWVAGSFLFRQL